MTAIRHVAVVDIGKTNAKVALVDVASQSEIGLRRTPNTVATDGLYPHQNVARLWSFILDSLAEINGDQPVDAVCVTTHGATAALVDASGELVLPVLDYEFEGPDQLAGQYASLRPDFAETGSPRLPMGLNLGAQLFWQQQTFPDRFARAASILMYPQYWSLRLTGIFASEVTSLGCHTDLWNPVRRDFSTLVDTIGWRSHMAPVRSARARLGPVLPEIVERTGLRPQTPVFCGIHDSNASLVPHLLQRRPPFSVVSTGTWVVAMAVGASTKRLDPSRDTLVNVDFQGNPVPSARYMGGREYALLVEGLEENPDQTAVEAVLREKIFLLPSVQQNSGPFPGMRSSWIAACEPNDAQRRVAISFYLAMMTSACLDLAGANGETIIEGPFAANRLLAAMLRASTGRSVRANAKLATGTSVGAAMLALEGPVANVEDDPSIDDPGQVWRDYARQWHAEIDRRLPNPYA